MFNLLCVFFGVQCFLDVYHHSCNTRYCMVAVTLNLKKNIQRASFLYNRNHFFFFLISTVKVEGIND